MNSDKIKYTQCSKCVMDTSDSLIQFDDLGVCNYCRTYDDRKKRSTNLLIIQIFGSKSHF